MDVRLSTARTIVVGPILDADGVAKTDEVVANIRLSKNGGTPAAPNGAATMTHAHTGYYLLGLTAADVSALGCLEISLSSGTNAMPIKSLNVMPALIWDALYAASGGLLPADKRAVLGTTLTESVAGYLAAAERHFFNVETPVLNVGSANQSADVGSRIPHDLSQAQVAGNGPYYVLALETAGDPLAPLDATETQAAARAAIAAALLEPPRGEYLQTFTVIDPDQSPLQNALVQLFGNETRVDFGFTDAAGVVHLACNAGDYQVLITYQGQFRSKTVDVTISEPTIHDPITLDRNTLPVQADPAKITGYLSLWDEHTAADAAGQLLIKQVSAIGKAGFDGAVETWEADEVGIASGPLWLGEHYKHRLPAGKWSDAWIAVDDGDGTMLLPGVFG